MSPDGQMAGRRHRAPRPVPDLTPREIARFYSKLEVSGCGVTWRGPVNQDGYGEFAIYPSGTRSRLLAHRVAYKLATGLDPGPEVVRHDCDTPPCCTPDCLLLGTQADNIHDAVERQRMDTSGLAQYRERRDAAAVKRLETGIKHCSGCKQIKPLDDFSRDASNVDGRSYRCRACRHRSEHGRSMTPCSPEGGE